MEAYNQTEWRATVQNGKIPGKLLANIEPTDYDADLGGPARMHPEAAWNYQRMRAAAAADGVTLTISYSYRTYAKQQEKYANYLAGGNLAAVPGTSNHGWALALDLGIPGYPTANTNKAFLWLKANAAKYGFHNNDAPSEPWHWDYEGGFPIEEEDEQMYKDFKKGWKSFQAGGPQPAADGDERFGWNAARFASSKPAPAEHDHISYAPKGHLHDVTGTAK